MAEVKYLDKTGLGTVWSKVKGIVTPKADKVSGATAGHLAGLNSSGNLTDSGLSATNVAQKDGSYSGMTVGAAEDLVSAESVASEFTSRITGGSTAVGKGGTALVDKIKGRTLVLNQMADARDVRAQNVSIISSSVDGFTVTAPAGSAQKSLIDNYAFANSSHVYYLSFEYTSTLDFNIQDQSTSVALSATTSFTRYSSLHARRSGAYDHMYWYNYASTSDVWQLVVKNYMVIDLTLMFGAGNEPSTAAEFEALYPGPYYAYTPGTLINNGKQTEYDLVWNQMCQGVSGVTLSYNSTTNTYYASGTRTYGEGGSETSAFVAGHIYCGKLVVKKDTGSKLKYVVAQAGGGSSNGLTFSVMNGTGTYTAYGTSPNAGNLRVLTTFGSSSVTFDVEFSLNVFDLTVMFGAGNEPATPEEFEAMFPNDYYPYDTGTQGHYSFPQFKTAIETVGWNIWDEEWENGSWTLDGTKYSRNDAIRCKNLIKVFPNTGYYISRFVSYLVFFDSAGNVLASSTAIQNTRAFTTPSGAYYVVFYVAGDTTYNNDICLSLSDPSRNGTYEPYWRSELELGLGDIKVKSHNIWDEEVEVGSYNTANGEKLSSSAKLRSKNKIPVVPGNYYYYKSPVSCNIFLFGEDGSTLVGLWTGSTNLDYDIDHPASSTFQVTWAMNTKSPYRIPSNAYYIAFSTFGSSYTNPSQLEGVFCFNESSPYDGRYEPYGDGGVISITGGLKSAGTVYDEISGNKLVKRIESVDLGTSTWTAVSDTSYPNRFQSVISGIAVTGNNLIPRYINKGIGGYGSGINEDKSFNQTSTTINVHDSSYTDVATFKASLAGVPLYFELAQPIEYELAEAIPTAMRNDPYGTERRLPEDTAAIVTAPFRADITYSTNIKEAVQSLPQNYINVNSMQDFLAALGEQMGGTWTMRPADGKFDFTFTPNPVEPTL